MKHSDYVELLGTLLGEAGLGASDAEMATLLSHVEWVIRRNETMNLTTITDPAEAVRLHVVDSLMAEPEVDAGPAGLLMDLGTGGGFPGVPLAVLTGRNVLLVDSVSKKVRALEEIVPLLDTRGTVSMAPLRAEELAGSHRGAAAVVVARALTALPSLVELASPLLRDDGILVAMKGALQESEIERGDAAGELVAMSRTAVRKYTLPGGGEQRTVVTYRRQGEPAVTLPRRVGLAQKSPLA